MTDLNIPLTRTRLRIRDESGRLWLQLIICAFVSFAAFGLFLRHGIAPAVIGYNLSPAERVLHGEVPYRDFLYNYTPGVLWLNAALFKTFGTSLATSREGVIIARILAVLILFLIARRFLSGWQLILPVAMALAWVGYGDVLKVFPTQYGMVFLLCSCLLVLKWQDSSLVICNSSLVTGHSSFVTGHLPFVIGRWLLVLAGASAGLVFLFKHNVGFYVLLAGLLSVFEPLDLVLRKFDFADALVRTKRCLFFLLGFALVFVLMSLVLIKQSAFVPMLEHFLRHATAYGEAKGIALPSPRVLGFSTITLVVILILGAFWRRLAVRTFPVYVLGVTFFLIAVILMSRPAVISGLGRSLVAQAYYLPIWATICTVAGSALMRARQNPIEKTLHTRFLTLAWFSTAGFLEVFPRSDTDHLVRALPLSLLLVVALISKSYWTGRDESTATNKSHAVLVTSAVSLLIIVIGVRVTWATQFDSGLRWKENTPLIFERGSWVAGEPAEAARLNAVVDYVAGNTVPGDSIFALSRKMTAIYFLSGRENTTRLPWFDSAGVTKQDRERIYQRIADREFKLILIGGDLNDEISEAQHPDESEADRAHERAIGFILRSYVMATTNNGVTIMSPKTD